MKEEPTETKDLSYCEHVNSESTLREPARD